MFWIIVLDWLEFAVRWLHVVTAIAWIGSSFYFIALDLGLRPSTDRREGVSGEAWQVHGGGFYFIQKYLVSPSRMPNELTWFKWESYGTWLSGAALLMLVYWAGAELYLVDQTKFEMAPMMGVVVSAVSLTIGWIVYNALCKTGLSERPTLLMVLLFVLLMAMGWGYNQIFTGRAVLLHLGAFTATIMTANVFFIIMPNQRIVVKDLIAKRAPDAKYGKIAKLRSTHNNYLTLPVIFLMLSNHYPLAFASTYNWVIAGLVFLMGVTIRHFFNTHHAHKGFVWWTIPATILLFLAAVGLSVLGSEAQTYEAAEARALAPHEARYAQAEGFEETVDVVLGRCSMCHAREPGWPGIAVAPKGVMLETPADVAANARRILVHAGLSTAMPPANITWMEPSERAMIRAWIEAANG
ncbi:MAG: urate hydroxylase PuuD [Maritimibacter sp.]